MDQTLGEIRMFGGLKAPIGWALCNGQLLTIQGNEALYALLGTQYGGDGRTNFAVPDLRGRLPVGIGQGTATSAYSINTKAGSESIVISTAQMPAHTHTLACNTTDGQGTLNNPANAYMAVGTVSAATQQPVNNRYATASSTGSTMANDAISSAGLGSPVSMLQPTLAINFIIATVGVFPERPS